MQTRSTEIGARDVSSPFLFPICGLIEFVYGAGANEEQSVLLRPRRPKIRPAGSGQDPSEGKVQKRHTAAPPPAAPAGAPQTEVMDDGSELRRRDSQDPVPRDDALIFARRPKRDGICRGICVPK
ncbi:hypothetical protein THAOC_35251 [Thalassiosira oceanica]|uniref:Uncharacterized protein n=1 Tax=Thalassiosira oceanica TaxID=159749 RepID=K0R178_THAOC|nr:hypothetical protein THAOC_35251 [Thalassiosira oceanica]|eukprot:EJK46103.1 hypothetical protein THAOC_35251 [Thalassiosira oceanica]